MDVNQIGASGLLGSTIGQAVGELRGSSSTQLRSRAAVESKPSPQAADRPGRRALSILRQEIRQALFANFRIRIASKIPAYNLEPGAPSADDVASDALGAARQVAERTPLDASKSLADLRNRVSKAASDVRELTGDDDDDNDDIDDAVAKIGAGLDDLDEDAARNVESTASVLSVETRLRQRSTIRIRTQEGDIVRFDLRRAERLSATDIAMSDGTNSFTSTQVELSNRSRTVLTVKGDLNEAEFAAIQDVFSQASSIADEFFGGDIAAAFDMAAGIEFDSDQLARVKMRFRERLVSNVSYAAVGPVISPPADEQSPSFAPGPAPIVEAAPKPVAPTPSETPSVREAPTVSEASPRPEAPPRPDAPAVADTSTDAAAPVLSDALDGFFDLLSNFLKVLNEGFETGSSETSFRYYYSQSFKLEILKSVLHFSAPEESGNSADTAATLIDSVADDGDED